MATALLTAQQNAAGAGGAGGGATGGMIDPQALKANRELLAQEQRAATYLADQHATGKALVTLEKERLTIAREIAATQKAITGDLKAQHVAAVGSQAEKILGLGPGGVPTIPGVQALRFRERQVLTGEMKRAGMDPAAAAHETLAQIVKSMQQFGVDFPKSTLDSLRRINQVLALAVKEGVKLPEDVRTNLRDRLKQIDDTLKQHAPKIASNYMPVSVKDLTGGLGLSRDHLLVLESRIAQAQAHGGKRPTGIAAAGIPLTPGYQPITVHGDVHVHTTGKVDVDHLAREIRQALIKTSRRNAIQTSGHNAGRGIGLS
jgi:hypothetical protein